eukprot:4227695-Pleurochrysis_carterae.AAC.1
MYSRAPLLAGALQQPRADGAVGAGQHNVRRLSPRRPLSPRRSKVLVQGTPRCGSSTVHLSACCLRVRW